METTSNICQFDFNVTQHRYQCSVVLLKVVKCSTGKVNFPKTTNKMFCNTSEAEAEVGPKKAKLSPPRVIHSSTFQGSSSVVVICLPVFVVRSLVTFHFTCVYIILVQFGFLSESESE